MCWLRSHLRCFTVPYSSANIFSATIWGEVGWIPLGLYWLLALWHLFVAWRLRLKHLAYYWLGLLIVSVVLGGTPIRVTIELYWLLWLPPWVLLGAFWLWRPTYFYTLDGYRRGRTQKTQPNMATT